MISFVNVTKIFYPEKLVFDDVNFDIEDGDFVFITGISGSGKTTLLKLLIKAEEPTEGDVVFDGQSLNALRRRKMPKLRQRIGVVFQDYKLLAELTVAENIGLPLSIAGMRKHEINERVEELLQLINLEDRAKFFPSQLSGGEAQRVGIARALASAPEVIFADEPTGNLDRRASIGIAKLLKKINELGTTVIVSTHNPELLDIVKTAKHFHLRDGQIMECKCDSQVLIKESNTKPKKKVAPVKKEVADDEDEEVRIEGELAVAVDLPEVEEMEVAKEACQTPPKVKKATKRIPKEKVVAQEEEL